MAAPVPAQGPAVPLAERVRQVAAAGQVEHLRELCRLGVPLEADQEGRTALHLAAANGHVDAVKVLLQSGSNVNQADASGYTPLHQAATEGHVEAVRLLLKHGIRVDAQDELHGNTALHEAAWKGYSQTLDVLCKHKANVYIRNKGGFSPLHLACQNGHNQSCRVLLLSGCKPDIKNNYGDTPLHTAARYGHAGVLRILISAYCNVNDINKNGDTALHISTAMGRRKLTRILLEAGSDQSIKNKQDETARDITERKDFTEVNQILSEPIAKTDSAQENEKEEKKLHKKREKESGTSQGSRDSSSKLRKDKHKKSKHGHRVHFNDEKKLWNGNWSPYGCHMFPNMSAFPQPDLDSLPNEPLKKGEQYYIDLAGNICKGPVGVGYACYCAPFFHHVEKKLEADKQELIDHIDHARDDLNTKITNLERRTRKHIFNLNQTVQEKLAAEKMECLERVERRALRDRLELDRQHELRSNKVKMELRTWVQHRVANLEAHHAGSPNGRNSDHTSVTNHLSEFNYWSPLPRKADQSHTPVPSLPRSKSEEILSEVDGEVTRNGRKLCTKTSVPLDRGPRETRLSSRTCGVVNGHPRLNYVQRLRTDFEKLGAMPKQNHLASARRDQTQRFMVPSNSSDIKRDCRSEGDLTRTANSPSLHTDSPVSDSVFTKLSPNISNCIDSVSKRSPVTTVTAVSKPQVVPSQHTLGIPNECPGGMYNAIPRDVPVHYQHSARPVRVVGGDFADAKTGTSVDYSDKEPEQNHLEEQLCKLNEGLKLSCDLAHRGASLV